MLPRPKSKQAAETTTDGFALLFPFQAYIEYVFRTTLIR